jgi:hypothetical protein
MADVVKVPVRVRPKAITPNPIGSFKTTYLADEEDDVVAGRQVSKAWTIIKNMLKVAAAILITFATIVATLNLP